MSDAIGQTVHSPVFVPVGYGGTLSRSIENPANPLSQVFDDELFDGLVGPRTTSGVRVSRKKALGYSAIFRCVTLISSKIAAIPFKVFKAQGQGKEVDKQHPAYPLLRRRPNAWMTAITLKETLQSHALLRGNGYGYIPRDADARPLEILPLNPEATWPVRVDGRLWYVTEITMGDGTTVQRRLRNEDVIHIRGMGFDGLVGYDVISILRETIGKALATREHGTRFFSNNAKPSVALEFPMGMKDAAIANVVAGWNRMGQGLENAHKVAVLREGIKLNSYSVNARDSQLTENLTFDAVDVANIFGLPPRKVGLDQGGGYNSLFEENQSVHDDVLDPWCAKWEEECDQKLLTKVEQESESHFCLYVRNALMRSNPDQRAGYYSKMIENGSLNPDEVRSLEDLNPIPDGKGQTYYMKAGMVPLGEVPAQAKPLDQAPLANSLKNLLAETAGRMARRLSTHIERKNDPQTQADAISEAFEGVLAVVRAAGFAEGIESRAVTGKIIEFVSTLKDPEPRFEQKCVDLVLKTVFPEG